MRNFLRRAVFAVCALAMGAGMCFSAYAYEDSDKAIKSVSITVAGKIEIEEEIGREEIEVHTSGNKYSFDHYEVQNAGFRWYSEDVPVIRIYLAAEEGYYFRITKASQIRLNGAEYVSAGREDSAYTLWVEVKLPSLESQVGEVGEARLEGGKCSWSAAGGAGSYELKFMRKGTTLGGNQIIPGTSYDGTKFMTKAGSYHFMVRPVNARNPEIRGRWTDSNEVNISEAQAKAQQEANAAAESAGSWIEEGGRWWFRRPDGGYAREEWKNIRGEWYAFDELGWMRTGWYMDGGKWYYLDPESGAMWKNAVTPDGYTLGIDGVMASAEQGSGQ